MSTDTLNNPSEGRTDDSLARQIAAKVYPEYGADWFGDINPLNQRFHIYEQTFRDAEAKRANIASIIQPLIASLQKASKLWEMDAGSFKAAWNNACYDIAELEKRMEQSESQLSALRDALKMCVEALKHPLLTLDHRKIRESALQTASKLIEVEEGR